MPKVRKIKFRFDERSLEPLSRLVEQGQAPIMRWVRLGHLVAGRRGTERTELQGGDI